MKNLLLYFKNFLNIGILSFCVVHVYGTRQCVYCRMASFFLSENNVKFHFHDVRDSKERKKVDMMLEEIGLKLKSVPQIFACNTYIGGYSDMISLQKRGILPDILEKNNVKHELERVEEVL